jgi:hypothetical protein
MADYAGLKRIAVVAKTLIITAAVVLVAAVGWLAVNG